jgi:hypothetical protein
MVHLIARHGDLGGVAARIMNGINPVGRAVGDGLDFVGLVVRAGLLERPVCAVAFLERRPVADLVEAPRRLDCGFRI